MSENSSAQSKENESSPWSQVSLNEVARWASDLTYSRGRLYQREGAVEDLAVTDDHRLLASVQGNDFYTVLVWLSKSTPVQLGSRCTCPVEFPPCKHAVAVVTEYLDRLNRGQPVDRADDDDLRWSEFDNDEYDNDDEDFDEDDNGDDDKMDEDETVQVNPPHPNEDSWKEKLRQHLLAKTGDELVNTIIEFTNRFPQIRDEFRERITLAQTDVSPLISQAKKEMLRVTAERGWYDRWHSEGSTPDYSKLQHLLERLLELGQADAIVSMGPTLLSRGTQQIEQSNDAGASARGLSLCFGVVFKAVAASNLSPGNKLLYAVDTCLQNKYDLIGNEIDVIFDLPFEPADWSETVTELKRRLADIGYSSDSSYPGDYSRNYSRDRLVDWLVRALENAKRDEEIIPLLEIEAGATNSYARLVAKLIKQSEYTKAEQWAKAGIEKTEAKLPGIAFELAKLLQESAVARQKWDIAAAHAAFVFFDSPTVQTFTALLDAADKADCKTMVEQAAHLFLETGIRPAGLMADVDSPHHSELETHWPLPLPAYLLPLLDRRTTTQPTPRWDVLMDFAIEANRPSEALKFFDKMTAAQSQVSPPSQWRSINTYRNRVAAAVTASHPKRAVEIYYAQLEDYLRETGDSAYERVVSVLRKIQPILLSMNKPTLWRQLLTDIREKYRNRPKLMQRLEVLNEQPTAPKIIRRR